MAAAERRLQPRRTPRQVRAELTRKRILAAAAHIFAEHGYAAGTTNRIAEHARVSIGSLYQYFPNKDAILAALLVQHIDRGVWTQADQLDLSAGSLKALVRALVRDAIDHHDDDPQLLRIMIEEAPASKELRDAIDRHGRTRVAQVRDLLARHPDVTVRDLDTAAELITFTVEINTHRLMAGPRAIPVETLETELVDMITRYLRGDRQP
ncbi:TetR/AcrR family transcriptional regulator [Micromonospora carbonacea]|uniref:TetR/AcrR family transcriptional regulator n=1 Tax=Micromonospora carbonacea TaxID=47853 RepID=A0A7H8XJH2_9ACTN|nr:TetR/AcrR family transcriptional regulator [Micromonospora carbonacea]MBB5827785.1 AcrR family transcriptional regulator [Micromonospora carbonacea]QLD24499.1 TetR/AcrR family transcriptional regulator [Micromonospora carbonacea]